MMVIHRFLSVLPLILLGFFSTHIDGQVEMEKKLEVDVSTQASSIRGRRRQQDCADWTGAIFFQTDWGTSTRTKCSTINPRNREWKCGRVLSANMGAPLGATIGAVCPVVCGECGNGGGFIPPAPTPSGGNNNGGTIPSPTPVWNNPGRGRWGPLFKTNVLTIHSMLVPGGESGVILSYGTNNRGAQRADLYYEAWNLDNGVVQSQAHVLLKHYTQVDLFCSSLNIDPKRGSVLIVGGDTRNPVNGLGVDSAQEYLPDSQRIISHPKGKMHYPRWYPTSIILPSGEIFIIGGRSDKFKKGSAVPEVYNANTGFRQLIGATVPIIAQDGTRNHWWYPHTFVNSKGQIVVIMPRTTKGKCYTYVISEKGNGSIRATGQKPFVAHVRTPSIMFQVDKVLMLDDGGGLWVVDISDGNNLKWRKVNNIWYARVNASFTILPDGRVTITGGCRSQNDGGSVLGAAVRNIQIYDPVRNTVTTGGNEIKSRLYHSSALLTTHATVISSGGGAPGPETNLNGQEYFPDYMPNNIQNLEKISCPKTVNTNGKFVIKVNNSNNVAKVTAIKSGSSSHTRNCDARWLELNFNKNGNDLEVNGVIVEGQVVPLSNTIVIPGLWLIYTLDRNGVPSKACLVGADMNDKYL